MAVKIEVIGLEEIRRQFERFPNEYRKVISSAMDNALLVLWENVPSYPAKPDTSEYIRTGTLGRTLGVSQTGAKTSDRPEIYEVKTMGTGMIEGNFGTRLKYAPYVIGDTEQAGVHRGRWWTLSKVAERAKGKIEQVFRVVTEELAAFLARQR